MVSADGLSFEGRARSPADRDGPFAIWSRHTLREGAQRWSFRLPAGRACWVGVGDIRCYTRNPNPCPKIAGPIAPDGVYMYDWRGRDIRFFSIIRTVPWRAHAALHKQTALTRVSDAFKSQPTIVQCTFDDTTHTLRMEIAGEPEAGVLLVPHMISAEFLCPHPDE
jgi:hypothetical protein